jgi:hypothetical protein
MYCAAVESRTKIIGEEPGDLRGIAPRRKVEADGAQERSEDEVRVTRACWAYVDHDLSVRLTPLLTETTTALIATFVMAAKC